MAHLNTNIRTQFLAAAIAQFGPGAVITKQQVDQVAANVGLANPQWFYRDEKHKIGRNMYQLPQVAEFLPSSNVIGQSMPMYGNMPNVAQMAPALPEKTDDELLVEIQNAFMTLDIMAESIRNGTTTSLIVAGPAGVGKSHNIEKVLGAENPNVFYNHGKMKATSLYKKLYEFRQKGQVVVIDDSDELFSEELSLNILKHALDTKENRHLNWGSDYELVDDEGQLVPKSFNYRGSVVFITNLDFYQEINKGSKIGKHLAALLSRSHYIDIQLNSTRKMFLHTCNVLYTDNMLSKLGLFDHEQDELVQYMEDNLTRMREITPRAARLLAERIIIGRMQKIDWRILADQMNLK